MSRPPWWDDVYATRVALRRRRPEAAFDLVLSDDSESYFGRR
jgi:hypothetical protein